MGLRGFIRGGNKRRIRNRNKNRREMGKIGKEIKESALSPLFSPTLVTAQNMSILCIKYLTVSYTNNRKFYFVEN